MFKNIVFSAFGAALAIGLSVTALQFFTTEPLILHAEQYEGGAPAHDHGALGEGQIPPVAASEAEIAAGLLSLPTNHGLARDWQQELSKSETSDFDEGRPESQGEAAAIPGGGIFHAAAFTPSRESLARLSTSPQGGGSDTFGDGEWTLVQAAPLDPVPEEQEWSPADGIERSVYTALANLVVGFAVSLMLLGAMLLKGEPIDARRGLLWGIAGFAAISLLPSLGLPPELPGTPAADIAERQVWWLGAAAASAAGIALLVFGRNWMTAAGGVLLVLMPHLVGAPEPPSHDVAYPGALAGEFVVASLVVSAFLWSVAGLASGWLYQRFSARG